MAVIFVILWYNRMTCKKRADHGKLPGIALEDLERRCSDGLYHPLSVPSGALLLGGQGGRTGPASGWRDRNTFWVP